MCELTISGTRSVQRHEFLPYMLYALVTGGRPVEQTARRKKGEGFLCAAASGMRTDLLSTSLFRARGARPPTSRTATYLLLTPEHWKNEAVAKNIMSHELGLLHDRSQTPPVAERRYRRMAQALATHRARCIDAPDPSVGAFLYSTCAVLHTWHGNSCDTTLLSRM